MNHVPLPPPRRESFHFSPTGADPLDYDSLLALANDLSPGMLTFTQNEKAILKESYTVKSTASYSYSETSSNTVQQEHQSSVPNDISSCSASASANTQAQERKVSSLKITPVTIPDPPAHTNSYSDPQTKTTSSPPPASPPPQKGPNLSPPQTQSASPPAGQSEGVTHPTQQTQTSSDTVELKVTDQALKPTPGPPQPKVEMTKGPPAVPPRPSAAQLLVHN